MVELKTYIFIFFKGDAFYLKYACSQVRAVCPASELILIGNDENAYIEDVTHVDYHDYFKSSEAFAQIYTHFSTNNYDFDLLCFQRWFMIQEYMENNGLSGHIIHLDPDVLLFEDVTKLFDKWNFDLATTNIVGPMYTFFKSEKILKGLTEFIFESYKNADKKKSIENIYTTGICPVPLPGGWICDMTLLGLYAKSLGINHLDLGIEREGKIFDYALREADGFDFNRFKDVKIIRWKNGMPYGIKEGREIFFRGLHFQVGAKVFLPHFYRGKRFFLDWPLHQLIKIRGYLTTAIKWLLEKIGKKV